MWTGSRLCRGSSRLRPSAAGALDALGLDPQDKRYVSGFTSLTPVELAAAYGGRGGVLDALGLDPKDKRYVQGVTSLTTAQVAAGYGR